MTSKRAKYFNGYAICFLSIFDWAQMIYSMIDIRQIFFVICQEFKYQYSMNVSFIQDLNMRFHMVILYCATSIAMNMKGRRFASRDIKHWIMHNSYICRPPKTFSFEVFENIKINFFVPSGHKSGHKIFYKMKRTVEWIYILIKKNVEGINHIKQNGDHIIWSITVKVTFICNYA